MTGTRRPSATRAFLVASLATVLAVLAGCGGDDEPRAAAEPILPERDHVVRITSSGFSPRALQLEVGDRVVFVNQTRDGTFLVEDELPGVTLDPSPWPGLTRHDGAEINHADRRGFTTHLLYPREAQIVVFDVARSYQYEAQEEPSMTGTIDVRRTERTGKLLR